LAEDHPVGAAIAVVDYDDLVDIVEVDGDLNMVPERGTPCGELVVLGAEGGAGQHNLVVFPRHPASGHEAFRRAGEAVIDAIEQQRVGPAGGQGQARIQARAGQQGPAAENPQNVAAVEPWVMFQVTRMSALNHLSPPDSGIQLRHYRPFVNPLAMPQGYAPTRSSVRPYCAMEHPNILAVFGMRLPDRVSRLPEGLRLGSTYSKMRLKWA